MTNLPPSFDHGAVEAHWSAEWERAGLFNADPHSDRPKYSIILPPPSVSAKVHLGHALQAIVQDMFARYRRMTGHEVLWLPGLDHAMIATQRAVERELAKEGLTKEQVGREAFAERVARWSETFGDSIVNDLRNLGCSVDWPRLRFTNDAASERSVRTAFVRLWDAGLVYQAFRIVNWCATCSSVLSTRQLARKEAERETLSIAVDLEGGDGRIVVRTERPELLPAAVAIVADPSYAGSGDRAVLPLTGETVPIVLDAEACHRAKRDAFLLYPGHDPEHWAIGTRHGLEPRVVLDDQGRVTAPDLPSLDGLPVHEARLRAKTELESGGRIVEQVVRSGALAVCELCASEVEQVASRQWFVSMDSMAERARAALDAGEPGFHPTRYATDYRKWLEGLQDWCISRQLWHGPRLPVFTCVCGHRFAAVEDPERCPECGAGDLSQETDVLDTWFSQAIWQSSALGWPDEHDELMAFHPTSLTVTSRDALRLGISKMIMVSLQLTGRMPFHDAVITCVVLAPNRCKMDTAKGTAIAPAEIIASHGTDALRGWAITAATIGQDVCLDEGLLTGWRRTAVKLWNATRLLTQEYAKETTATAGEPSVMDRWIVSRLHGLIETTTSALETFEPHKATRALGEFIREDFLNRYLEAVKPQLRAGDPNTRETAVQALDVILRLLHPFLPFVTEELWQRLPGERPLLERCPWPDAAAFGRDEDAELEVESRFGRRGRRSKPRPTRGGTPTD